MRKTTRLFCFFICCLLVFSVAITPLSAKEAFPLEGKGTVSDPFLIEDFDDLCMFRDLVNGGKSFFEQYVQQTADIDLGENNIWEPIGNWSEDYFFQGVYNGGGHVLYNLNTDASISGFFTLLRGTVMNLGIESGTVKGDYAGAIASHGTGTIINCYSLADVTGIRAGGLADNFLGGLIIDSWCAGNVNGTDASFGIVSYGTARGANCIYVGDNLTIPEDNQGIIIDYCQISPENVDITELKKAFKDNSNVNLSPMSQLMGNIEGDGVEKSPFLIKTAYNLKRLSILVNIGCVFGGQWFRQENDIDLSEFESWTPIGGELTSFSGIYDGAGHSITNLNIVSDEEEIAVGLFGSLSGTVMNLGIESGRVEGYNAAALVGSSMGDSASIINCYNNCDVVGLYSAGGIANSFENGIIINCLNTGNVYAPEISGGICALSVKRMLNCYSLNTPVAHEDTQGVIVRKTSFTVDNVTEAIELLNSELYDVATFTNYQRNNLVTWSDDGTLSNEYHNYIARFVFQEILIAVALFLLIGLLIFLYKTYGRVNKLCFAEIKQTVVCAKKSWHSGLDKKVESIFLFGMLFGLGMIAVAVINGDLNTLKAFSWPDQNDAFMDFYNPMASSINDNVADNGYYSVIGATYPPIAALLLWCIGNCLPFDLRFLSAKDIRSTTVGLFFAVFLFLVCCILLIYLYRRFGKKNKFFLPLVAILSSPMLFLFDRGNLVIITLTLSALFIAGYRSSNSFIRHCSYVCLALAASIKIYPAALGLLVLLEKKWKHTIQCVIYGVIFCVLPFFVIGLDELALYIRNITSTFDANSEDIIRPWLVDYSHILSNWSYKFFGNLGIGQFIAKYTIYPLTFLLVGCVFMARERWKSVLAVMFIQILYPSLVLYYCLSLLAIPMFMLIGESNKRKIDCLYAALFVLALVPLQFLCGVFGWHQHDVWTFGGTASFILAMVLIVDCSVDFAKRVREWHKNKLSVELAEKAN